VANPKPATPPVKRLALCFIGAGRVGSVLAHHFYKLNFPIAGIIERSEKRQSVLKSYFPDAIILPAPAPEIISTSAIIFISVQDDEIMNIVQHLDRQNIDFSEKIFVHTSGAYASDILNPLKEKKALIASAHPIFSFGSDLPDQSSLEGVYFDVDGDAPALNKLKELFHAIGSRTIEVSADQKLAIHIASVFYSNFLTGLAKNAQEILRNAGMSGENLWQPFLPLIQSTLDNLSTQPPASALTGPVKRGDFRTVDRHLQFIATNFPAALPIYVEVSRSILELTSLPEETKKKLSEVMEKYQR